MNNMQKLIPSYEMDKASQVKSCWISEEDYREVVRESIDSEIFRDFEMWLKVIEN